MSKIETNALTTLTDMQAAAKAVAPTFAMSPDQVVALFLIAQAEGMHPMAALRIYHIIEGKPSMRADAMQAKFQERGGVIKWTQTTEDRAAAWFSHPKLYPEPVEVALSCKEADDRGLVRGKDNNVKKNWLNHRGAMLRARVISAGVRMVDPGTVVGLYTPEEIEDMPKDAQDVVVHEPGESPRHAAIRAAAAEETTTSDCVAIGNVTPDAVTVPAPEQGKVTRSTSKAPGPAPKQEKIVTPSGGSKVLVPVEEGKPVTVEHLLDACRRYMNLVGKDKSNTRLTALNKRYACGLNEKGVAVVSKCPADSIASYLMDIEEEVSFAEIEIKRHAALASVAATAGAPL